MISQRQAGFDRNPAKLIKDGGQKVPCICGERAKRLLDRWRTIIVSTPNDNIGRICHEIVNSREVFINMEASTRIPSTSKTEI